MYCTLNFFIGRLHADEKQAEHAGGKNFRETHAEKPAEANETTEEASSKENIGGTRGRPESIQQRMHYGLPQPLYVGIQVKTLWSPKIYVPPLRKGDEYNGLIVMSVDLIDSRMFAFYRCAFFLR